MTPYPHTRAMAKLYLHQGYVERSVSIYRHLLWQSPEDTALLEEYKTALAQRKNVVLLIQKWMGMTILYRQCRALSLYAKQKETL